MKDREKELREQLAAGSTDSEALRELAGLVGADRARKDEAVELWRSMVAVLEPSQLPEGLLALARAQVEARREEEAIETLARCTADSPDNFDAHDLLGELLRRAGRLEEAADALRRAGELDPRAVRPRAALLACLDGLGWRDEADRVLGSLQRLGADDPAVGALVEELMRRRG